MASNKTKPDLRQHADAINLGMFEQFLRYDEGPKREFSRSSVVSFVNQGELIFPSVGSLKNESPEKISSKVSDLGESASLLGFTKVQNDCKEIRTIAGEFTAGKLSRSEALDKLSPKIDKLKTDYEEIRDIMIQFYGGLGG
ncbi:hypothetical protein VTN31DRAFT_4116 [Thermomyces dupontii]|uniref:uncharacterized protein n=1 Tax=Talaromyces thermophilus TaxID=28565 RepID=UPI0037437232